MLYVHTVVLSRDSDKSFVVKNVSGLTRVMAIFLNEKEINVIT